MAPQSSTTFSPCGVRFVTRLYAISYQRYLRPPGDGDLWDHSNDHVAVTAEAKFLFIVFSWLDCPQRALASCTMFLDYTQPHEFR